MKFPLPDACQCGACGRKEPATYEYKNTVYIARHLDLFGQPCFLVFQPCFHRCSRLRQLEDGHPELFDGRYTSAAVEGIIEQLMMLLAAYGN